MNNYPSFAHPCYPSKVGKISREILKLAIGAFVTAEIFLIKVFVAAIVIDIFLLGLITSIYFFNF